MASVCCRLGDVVKVLPLLVGAGSVALTAKLWADYRRPAAVPPGTSAAPLAWVLSGFQVNSFSAIR